MNKMTFELEELTLDVGIIITDLKLNILEINPFFIQHLTMPYRDKELAGENLLQLFSFHKSVLTAIANTRDFKVRESVNWREENHIFPLQNAAIVTNQSMLMYQNVTIEPFRDGLMFKVHNATQEAVMSIQLSQAHETLQMSARRCPMTGIFNRMYILNRLEELDANYKRNEDREYSLLLLDIDHFKTVNDTYGHDVGDQVLIWFAQLLETTFRETDLVGRYGGEEFIVVMTNPKGKTLPHIGANRLLEILARTPFKGRGLELNITASIGAVSCFDAPTPEKAIGLADELLYEVKRSGRNNYRCIEQPEIAQLA
ncbi:GGDEF domain-containing protein [Photobacterium sp. ZSDE20]|uniref:diguanylate cyclase n=1 Tax=Photobacterium pectinilyticum TaxID=2906793 RepID=A0ABT1N0U3_9GAMM|nr:GGDEF domain-containing protein [Photobacterium sp. ZSDE20]MCQ1058348.1 GGDEF domain-containing protein [Photobacterium sp. ZSDE20]MDD1826252.1 GGDEF domain-containing protein [Photobacterium sp. ZSDE20]